MSRLDPPTDGAGWRPHPAVWRATVYSGCFVVIAAAVWIVLIVVPQLALVLFPMIVTLFLVRILDAPARLLRRWGARPALVGAVCVLGLLLVIVALVALIAPPVVEEFSDLGGTLDDGLGQVEDWVVEDSPLDVTRGELDDFEDDLLDRGQDSLAESQDQVIQGVQATLSGLAGLILALILTFFSIKDGPLLVARAPEMLPSPWGARLAAGSRACWDVLGGYLRGAALLGAVEAAVIGLAMALVGSDLVLPVMLLTFFAAFVPLVGAIVAGVVAVLVVLATAGFTPALIVAVVALAVQQLDNDLLAPWIYGAALSLHPVVILLSITAGTALFGFVGAVLAVPTVACVLATIDALRRTMAAETDEPPPAAEPAAPG